MKHRIVNITFLSLLLLLGILGYLSHVSFWYLFTAAIVWFAIVLFGSSFIWTGYHVKAYCGSSDEKANRVALTFDDGPGEFTPLVLDMLKKHNAKATFFCIGKNIAEHPEILQQTIAEGHTIGNHSFSHDPFFDFYRTHTITAELHETDALIQKYAGKRPLFFRPPYGVTTPSIRRAVEATKHIVIGWNIRSMDGITKNKGIILSRIEKRIKPGGVILLHDTSMETVSVLEQLLLTLRRRNYEVVPIEQLLDIQAYED
jgi:peptidoglycan/xylan/chitin deacetylase (PgdA/CDA1 family)